MPFHFCADELFAIMMMIPFIGIFFRKLHTWYHTKYGHKCHEKECLEIHAEHVEEVEIPVTLEEETTNTWHITTKGLVAGCVLSNEPISEEDLLKSFVSEDIDRLKEALENCLSEGIIIRREDGKLIFGNL
jgi:hypothetical protein